MEVAKEFKGHRLVPVTSPQGKAYWLPQAYAQMPISECIRRLWREQWSKAQISRHTGILYQHVRNVVEQDASRHRGSSPRDDAIHDPSADTGESRIAPSTVGGNGIAVNYQEAQTISDVLDEARRKVARLANVPAETVRLELNITLTVARTTDVSEVDS
jgi:hypothetical protein